MRPIHHKPATPPSPPLYFYLHFSTFSLPTITRQPSPHLRPRVALAPPLMQKSKGRASRAALAYPNLSCFFYAAPSSQFRQRSRSVGVTGHAR